MQLKNIFISLTIIETNIRNDNLLDINLLDRLVTEEIKNIFRYTDDVFVNELIAGVYFEWKDYSGQMSPRCHRLNLYEELENIFADCQRIRTYLINNSTESASG